MNSRRSESSRRQEPQIGRRRFIGGIATAGIAAAAAGLVDCSSSNSRSNSGAQPASSATSASAGTAATRAAASAGAAGSPTPVALDSTKGKPGGVLKEEESSYPAAFTIVDQRSAGRIAGMVHSGLLGMRWCVEGVKYNDYSVEPDAAQSLPEQTDDVTYVYKLRSGIKFHNGKPLTAADVKYSYDSYTNDPKSATASMWQAWYDHIETPDPLTVVIKTKAPYADTLTSTAAMLDGYIMSKEFVESPDGPTKMMGSGPFQWVDAQPPVHATLKKNPDYYLKPFPYFDGVEVVSSTDAVTRIQHFITHQVHMPWVAFPDDQVSIQKGRPDAKIQLEDPNVGPSVFFRSDRPPFNDKRVRQALSMAIDRKTIRNNLFYGQGRDEQFFAIFLKDLLGTHEVKDLGAASKYWTYDPQAAKQLMAATGVTLPIQTNINHYNAAFIGQWLPDMTTLIAEQWRQLGFADLKDVDLISQAYASTVSVGKYEGVATYLANGLQYGLNTGSWLHSLVYWGPNGEHSPLNVSYTNDPTVSDLSNKQITQLKIPERQQSFRDMEAIMAEQQFYVCVCTASRAWYFDPSLENALMSGEVGSRRNTMKWWFK